MSDPSKLDGIIARAEAFEGHGTPGRRAPEDRKVLLDAIRAVEAVAAPTGGDYTFDLGYAAALDKVRNTIREALGA